MAQNVFGNICCTPLVSTSSNAALRMVLNVRSTWVGFGKKEFASREGLQPTRLSQFVFHHGFSPKTKPADFFQFSSGGVSSCSDVSSPSKARALFEGRSQKGHNQFLPPNGTYASSYTNNIPGLQNHLPIDPDIQVHRQHLKFLSPQQLSSLRKSASQAVSGRCLELQQKEQEVSMP